MHTHENAFVLRIDRSYPFFLCSQDPKLNPHASTSLVLLSAFRSQSNEPSHSFPLVGGFVQWFHRLIACGPAIKPNHYQPKQRTSCMHAR